MAEKEKTVKQYISAVGRRKSAIARVRLYTGAKTNVSGVDLKKGEMIVNGKPIIEYFKFFAYSPKYNKFLKENEIEDKFAFSAKVIGGGMLGQLDALILGMARALDEYDKEKFHSNLRSKGYLTRDARVRERRKVGMGGKARRKKQSPKR